MRLAALLLLATIALPFAARAEDTPQPGVQMTVYDGFVWPSQPWETAPDWEPCYAAVVPMIDFSWGAEAPAETCDPEFFIVHFEGWLTPSETGQYEWLNWSDDGWRMTLDGVLVLDDWNFHGCGGHWSGPNEGYSQLEAGVSYALDVWMFESTGAACASLWYGSPTNYGPVPAEWYSITEIPAPTPTPEPTPPPTPEPSVEPSPTQTPEPTPPSPSVAPTPTPEPSTTPPPTPEPTPEPPPTPEPTPEPTPTPTEPPPTVAPTQEPTNEPPPNPTATPQPTPERTVEPTLPPYPPPSPDPTAVPPPEPTQPPLPNLEEVAAAVEEVAAAAVEAVSESVAAIGGGIADIAAIGEIGKDLDPAEKEEAAPMAVAVISSQIASVTAAAANAARGGGSTPSGGNLGGGGGGGADAPKTRKTSSRKELK